MQKLGFSHGDIVEITSTKKTVARCVSFYGMGLPEDCIMIDSITIENCGGKLGGIVQVKKGFAKSAEMVVLKPAKPIPRISETQILIALKGRIGVVGDLIDAEVGAIKSRFRFLIFKVTPSDSIIAFVDNTKVRIMFAEEHIIPHDEPSLTSSIKILGFVVERYLGEGGSGTVYKAYREYDHMYVALKIPNITNLQTVTQEMAGEIEKIAAAWQRLRHTNVIEVYDYGKNPVPWIAMEYADGGNLRNKLHTGITIKEAVNIGVDVADALYFAHHYGVIHRDLKPENLLFTIEDKVKVADWGLARVMLSSSSDSGFKGTYLYAAPEQVDPRMFGKVDWKTDIYQLGAVLYEMLTGKPPFESENIVELANLIVKSSPQCPSELKPPIPESLDKIVLKALEKRKNNRFEDISDFKQELKKVITEI